MTPLRALLENTQNVRPAAIIKSPHTPIYPQYFDVLCNVAVTELFCSLAV